MEEDNSNTGKVELQGNLVEEFVVNENLKLSMWIPSDLGELIIFTLLLMP
jgi:hypothetical protein